ncbi:MAG TPA: S8 family peptidase, partial [Pyrinomonadaceae bacterium]|nr:S8 family peptidase [Pyrinomonadaceae bacterium]
MATLDSTSDVQHGRKVSDDLLKRVADGKGAELVRVVIQPASQSDLTIDSAIETTGASDIRKLKNFKVRIATLPVQAAVALASRSDVSYVSLNRNVQPMGHVTRTTGTDQIRGNSTSGNNNTSLDGSGIGIAILDSGIDTGHASFLNGSNSVRVVYSEDFTNEGRTDDPYGHGTHVASLAAGNGRISNGEYRGIAPNANLINLRVLNSQGVGTTGHVLRALDWVATNRAVYNIRVVNMSLGMPAIDSYRNDPICRAVRRLVDAGVVVLAAAGNNGKDDDGDKVYGRIHSPGNEPSAITVGASNTFGTDERNDDGVTSYSSRGPTRSFVTDDDGAKYYDNLIKPDLVAPGNKLIDAEADNNYLVTQTPSLDAGVSGAEDRKMMYLSGSSMATPVAAGTAALMLQANPSLTPNLVKALLMYSAQPLAGFNMFEQGAGQLNVAGAVQLARLVRTDLNGATSVGSPLLTGDAPAPQTTIGNYTFTWSRGIVLNQTYATGVDLITRYQLSYSLGSLLGSGVITGDGVLLPDPSIFSDGVITGDSILTSYGVITGDGVSFLAISMLFQNLLADGVIT